MEDQILKKIECEQLHKFLLELSKEEQWLIQELYFEERTEREVASVLGLSQKAINKRRQKILEKLRKLFELFFCFWFSNFSASVERSEGD